MIYYEISNYFSETVKLPEIYDVASALLCHTLIQIFVSLDNKGSEIQTFTRFVVISVHFGECSVDNNAETGNAFL